MPHLYRDQPRGSTYTTIMGLGPQNHNGDGLLGPSSIIVVYMDPLGKSSSLRLPSGPNSRDLKNGSQRQLIGNWMQGYTGADAET